MAGWFSPDIKNSLLGKSCIIFHWARCLTITFKAFESEISDNFWTALKNGDAINFSQKQSLNKKIREIFIANFT